jgi:hypothetical protein
MIENLHGTQMQPSSIGKSQEGFFYVYQDNYCIVNIDNLPANRKYLYSDSATSCIILAIIGRDAYGNQLAALTHISRPMRFNYFFNHICPIFVGPVRLWAQGGNPPACEASIRNINTLIRWLDDHSVERFESVEYREKPSLFVEQVALSLGQGNPQHDNRSCLGIDLVRKKVTNTDFDLTLEQRDPTKGVQTLFVGFGMSIWPKIWLWNSDIPYPKELIDKLVSKAKEDNWGKILEMNDEEILRQYSGTPKYEPPWFVPTLRQSAEYIENYSV